jgi:multidrug resistance efflux pump
MPATATAPEKSPLSPIVLDATHRVDEGRPSRPPQRRISGLWMGGVVLLLLAGAAVGANKYWNLSFSGEHDSFVVTPVTRSSFLITVTEDGNLESASNVELKCEVEGGTTILEIVADGSLVKKGDQLALLDGATIEENFNLQKNTVGKAEATMISAKNEFEAAKISVQEYLEGTYLQSMQTIESDITIARQNLTSSENIARHSEEMVRKGYTTPQQHESNVYAVKKAKLDLEKQLTAKKVLEQFTKVKTQKDLESKRDTAEAKMKSEVAAYELELAKLKRLEANLKKCTLVAPQDGMVVYANDMSGGGRGGQMTPKIELGAAVRQYQSIVKLPELSNMQVKVQVHESKIEMLNPGQRARIKIQDRELQGTVTRVASQPEAAQWFSGGAKEYATFVKIDGNPDGLKPGMTAEVTILIDEKKDVLCVPIQCVVGKGKKSYAWVQTAEGVSARELLLGATNETLIEVKDGLKEGESVLQNPRADMPEALEDGEAAEPVDVNKTFGGTGTAGTFAEKASPGGPNGAATPAAQPGGPAAGAPGADPNGPRGAGDAGQRGGRGGQRRGGAMPTFKQMDKNGDGKVARDEFPEQAQPFFDRIDTSGDGFVDQAESKAADERRKQFQRQGGPGGPGGGFPGGPPAG